MQGKSQKTTNPIPLMFERLQQTGLNPRKFQEKTVLIVGLGGLGIIVADMLVRLGVGHFLLVDQDIVGEENLNRLGYDPTDIGKSKVKATRDKLTKFKGLRGAFPLKVETYKKNVIAWERLKELVRRSDIVFGCLDNLEARLEVNQWIVKLKKPFVDGGTSTNGLRGRVDTVLPFEFPCLGCYYATSTLTSLEEREVGYVCDRSVPMIMNLVASLQVDQGARILLGKEGIYPRIVLNLEDQVKVKHIEDVKRREECKFCSRNGIDR